ncbi:hypothetical protein BHM03_00012092 [Ensete ventricosum]|nr:hypothetical protein BHM03_00012092 [Ensete ventricosum]
MSLHLEHRWPCMARWMLVMCWAFPSTLRWIARGWYNRLLPASIHFFDQLMREFETNFLASAQPKPTVASLLEMRQKEDEPFGSYLAHFTKEIRTIPDANPLLVIQALMIGVRLSRFFWSLMERPSTTMLEMLQQTTNMSPSKLKWQSNVKTRSDRRSNPPEAHCSGSQGREWKEPSKSCPSSPTLRLTLPGLRSSSRSRRKDSSKPLTR